jgi:two-component sensor histidine kinase
VSNAPKYAFRGRAAGVIAARLARQDGREVLAVRDDGVGLPDGVHLPGARTLGLRLVAALAEQLHGSATLDRVGGTAVHVIFPPARDEAGKGGSP